MRQLGRGADRNGPIAQSWRLHLYEGTSQISTCASPLPRHLLHYAERGGRGPRAGPLAGRMSSGKFQIRPAEDRTDPAHLTAQPGGPVRGGPSRGPVGTRPTVWTIVRGHAFRGAGSASPPDGRLLTVTSLLSASLQMIHQRLHRQRRTALRPIVDQHIGPLFLCDRLPNQVHRIVAHL